jgi:ABC-2 type transport system ATP-binding protein
MAIRVQALTKQYGSQLALNGINFELTKGEIVGFLGPNGAGKSTTFKIATGYLATTKGDVWVNGISVTENALAVKKQIGYLPEHNPLYHDMYVHEYLRFCGKLHGIQTNTLHKRVAEMVMRCGLQPEQNKLIESLSKGYRQRVGLAQALLHNPEVLILDEPTSGLDPNQLVEIRKLIKQESENKTVIFSTHILQEVEALCDRVIIITKGEIMADEKLPALLQRTTKQLKVEIEGVLIEADIALLKESLASEVEVKTIHNNTLLVVDEKENTKSKVLHWVGAGQYNLIQMQTETAGLEKIFQQLTQQTEK